MKYIIPALLLTLLAFSPARAAPEDDVRAAESYLSSLVSAKARFIQTAADGTQMTGTFLLKRPGRLRFAYDPAAAGKAADFIVADGAFVHYYDAELKQHSHALIGQSLADFFLRKDVKLSGDLSVSNVRRDGGLLQITLEQAKDPSAGSLTLGFTENPMTLNKWRVVDAQGAITEVDLHNLESGIKLKNDLFKYYDPEHGKKDYN